MIGVTALVLWVLGQVSNHLADAKQKPYREQVFWLQQGFQLEFLGKSTFVPGLWIASILFFLINVGILGIIIFDVKNAKLEKVEARPTTKAS